MDIQTSIVRLNKSLELDKQFRTAMMACTANRCDQDLIETFEYLQDEFQDLLNETLPDDQLLTEQMIGEKLADLNDWYGRVLENTNRIHDAIIAFEKAASMFEALGKIAEARLSRDKAGSLKLDEYADFDEEIPRLLERLEEAPAGSLERVQVLVALGEFHSKSNDDFEAVKYLELAEKELSVLGGHPSDGDLLSGLFETVQAIHSGKDVAGKSVVETSLQRRALTQRLFLALGNAYRTTDPDQAARYEEILKTIDEEKHGNFRDMIGTFLDSDLNATRFLQKLNENDS